MIVYTQSLAQLITMLMIILWLRCGTKLGFWNCKNKLLEDDMVNKQIFIEFTLDYNKQHTDLTNTDLTTKSA